MWTVIGLSLDAVGVVLVGFVFPKHSLAQISTKATTRRASDSVGAFAGVGGWSLLLIGFLCQIVGAVR